MGVSFYLGQLKGLLEPVCLAVAAAQLQNEVTVPEPFKSRGTHRLASTPGTQQEQCAPSAIFPDG